MANIHLPEELVMMEILARLPVKSILRFKSVCKSWYVMLTSHSFVTQHLQHTASSRNNESILGFKYNCYSGKSIDSLPCNHNLRFSDNIFMPFFNSHVSNLNIAGHCHGIVCLQQTYNRSQDKVALWNPATKEFRALPSLSPVPSKYGADQSDYGIGFDSKTNDYKVVRISSTYDIPYHQVEVYKLSTNYWRIVDTIVPDTILPSSISSSPKLATYVKGFYYWRAEDRNNNFVILSFHMGNEMFRKILAPQSKSYDEEGLLEDGNTEEAVLDSLLEYNGSLAAIRRAKDWCGSLTIWVMNDEDGLFANYKWIKQLKIDFFLGVWRVLGLRKNGGILMESSSKMGGELASYCPRTKVPNFHGVYGRRNALEVVVYQESLVSLGRKNYLLG